MNVQCPLTKRYNTQRVAEIPVQYITEGYKKELGVDVSRFLGRLETVHIYRCNDTGYRFYHPENIFGDAAFYAELQKISFYYAKWTWEHEMAWKNIEPGSSVLEVGCGTGCFMQSLVQRGFSIVGLELNEAAVNVCRSKGLTVWNELLEQHQGNHRNRYDVICCFQVLEHVYDVHSFITCCLECLKPGGRLIVAVPNNNPWYFKYDQRHLLNLPPHHSGLWNKESFESLPRFFNLTLIQIMIEPLYNRVHLLQAWLQHHKWHRLRACVSGLRYGIVNRVMSPLRWFVDGKCVVAIFDKQ